MPSSTSHPFGISLSGGGLSSLAYAGLYEVLKEHDFQPAAMAGLSGGAILAVLLASGLSSEAIKKFLFQFETISIINTHFSKFEIIDHVKFIELFRKLLPYKEFEDLPIPVIVFATDLEKRQTVMLHQGDIASAIVASCSVFPLLQPVKRRGLILGDGGFTTYYGANYLRDLGVKKVLGIDVTGMTEGTFRGFLSALYRQINSSTTTVSRYELAANPVDLDIRIEFTSPNPLNFHKKADHLLEFGRKTAKEHMSEIRRILNKK